MLVQKIGRFVTVLLLFRIYLYLYLSTAFDRIVQITHFLLTANVLYNMKNKRIFKVDGTVSQRCVSKFKIEVRICILVIN